MKQTVNYSITGKGKEPVILFHGSMSTKDQWIPLIHELSDYYKVITFDLLGYGDTPLPETMANYSLQNESELVEAIVAEVLTPEEKYHLVGHSYGGVVACYHAFHHQERILSLTGFEPMCFHLLNKSDPLLKNATLLIDSINEDIRSGNPLTGVEKFMDLWVAPGSTMRMSDNEKKVMEGYIRKMVYDYRSASEEPLSTKDYAQLDYPVCLIAGKRSPEYSIAITELLKETLKNSNLHWVDGGHFAPVTHRKKVNDIIVAFLQTVQRSEKLAS